MIDRKKAINSALAGLMAVGLAAASHNAVAAKKEFEKCYGVVKAGKNDCQTNNSSCAGTSTADNQKDAWIFLPKGACEKLVGGSLASG